MDRLKRCRFLLNLSIILALVFVVAFLFVPNRLFRFGMLVGWVSMLLHAGAMYTEIRKIKKEQDEHHNI